MSYLKVSKYVWMALYVGCVLLANLTLNRFVDLGVLGSLSVGTLFFGAVFTLRDKLHVFGLPVVFTAIALALLVNYAVAINLDEPTPKRFLVASFLSILVSELADTTVYQRLMGKSWLARALSSNAISIPLDTVLFSLLAFYGQNSQFEFFRDGGMSGHDVLRIIWADLLFKTVVATGLAFVIHYFKNKKSV